VIPHRSLAGLGKSFLYDALVWVWSALTDAAVVTIDVPCQDWHCDWCGRDIYGHPANRMPLGWFHYPDAGPDPDSEGLAFCSHGCNEAAIGAKLISRHEAAIIPLRGRHGDTPVA
jgi:hypothetical protein